MPPKKKVNISSSTSNPITLDPITLDAISIRTNMKDLPKELVGASYNFQYLVLEVSEEMIIDLDLSDTPVERSYKVLRLLNKETGQEKTVNLWDQWSLSVIVPGDIVNIISDQNHEGGYIDVDDCNNFMILHPHILLSASRVADTYSCCRRAVLDERLKYSSYSSCNAHTIATLNGSILHQMFQSMLLQDDPRKEDWEGYAEVVLKRNLQSLYAYGVSEHDVRQTLMDGIPRMLRWISEFKNLEERKDQIVYFGVQNTPQIVGISEVIDIEEMAWAPKYGLKGKIDASVRVKVQSRKDDLEEKIMPLEFKTGKSRYAQLSVEHGAQVNLYALLMSERYQTNINSCLLYHLRSDQTQWIMGRRSEFVGLVMRRNELASDILKASTSQQLPPMLQDSSFCGRCRILDICSVYHKAHGGSRESSGLDVVFDSKTSHLTSSHLAFLCHWDQLIDSEAKEIELARKEMWQSHSLNSPSSGGLSSIVLDASYRIPYKESLEDNCFVYRFVRQEACLPEVSNGDPCSANDFDLTLRSGDDVILSNVSSGQPFAKGLILDISSNHITVSFSKCLRIPGRSSTTHDLLQQVWRIDKDEVLTSFAIMRFNLVHLFLRNDQSAHLRRMIVDLKDPTFECCHDPAISYVLSEQSLNDAQREAILQILRANDYTLIVGMPGTGKTSTIVHAVKALLIRGSTILLTAHTHSVVDNLLIKLKAQDIDFVRIGRREAVHEEVRGHCLSATNMQTVEDIRVRLGQVKVVAVTCLGICSPLLAKRRFDVCIMDEAAQTTLPESLGPLTFASKFVLVGDPHQLRPLVQSTEARKNGLEESLFCRLSKAHAEAISELRSQYRMCQGIMDLSNALIYENRLRCGSFEIANAKLEFSRKNCRLPWLQHVLNPDRPVIFIDTDMLHALEGRDEKTVNNSVEVHITAEVAKELVRNGIGGEQIGIITPYNSQANLIRNAECPTSIEVHTIDKYQGREKDCILISFVRSSDSEDPTSLSASLLGDSHRINVALTRAKKKLIMVGSRKTLSQDSLLNRLIKKVKRKHGIVSVSESDIYGKGRLKRCSQV